MTATDRPNRRRRGDTQLAHAIANGLTYARASEIAGVSERTARRRMKDPAFLELVDNARAETAERVADTLALGATAAVQVLTTLMRDEDVTASARVSAARALLQAALTWRDQVDVEQRLAALETAVAARHGLRVVRS